MPYYVLKIVLKIGTKSSFVSLCPWQHFPCLKFQTSNLKLRKFAYTHSYQRISTVARTERNHNISILRILVR